MSHSPDGAFQALVTAWMDKAKSLRTPGQQAGLLAYASKLERCADTLAHAIGTPQVASLSPAWRVERRALLRVQSTDAQAQADALLKCAMDLEDALASGARRH